MRELQKECEPEAAPFSPTMLVRILVLIRPFGASIMHDVAAGYSRSAGDRARPKRRRDLRMTASNSVLMTP